jgi:Na+/phosphate symporter
METMSILITAICTVVVSAITGFVTHILGKKKYLADTVSVEQQNLKIQMETYETFITNMSNRVNEVLLLSQEKEKVFKEKEAYFLEKEEMYIKKIEGNDKRMGQIEKVITKFMIKICIRAGCGDRSFLDTDEFERVEKMFNN